ncbi:fluoride efflux transporter FluC [Bacillus fonticola]|uniref:fluoride efflux transporter FluC n=1 Tax=Bacillus fonticola TaxID=2728853 RepID=UPI0014758F24|nr:CrcB family protein [Bacillus fonticola]
MRLYVAFFLAAGAGAVLRDVFSIFQVGTFPFATLFINVLGSFVIGFLSVWLLSSASRFIWMTGFCGGFTTMSTFSFEVVGQMRAGEWDTVFLYVVGTIFLGLIAVYGGQKLAKSFQVVEQEGEVQ